MVEATFIARRTTTVVLRDGTRIRLRPIVPDDKEGLLGAFDRLSPESRYRRFFGGVKRLTPELLRVLTEIDYVDHFAWVAQAHDEPGHPGVGAARYVRLRDEAAVADAAVAVVDDYHGRGLGTILLEALAAAALENGIMRFRAYTLVDNHTMIDILKAAGARFTIDSPGVYRVDLDLPERAEKLRGTPMYEMLRAAARGEIPVMPGRALDGG